MGPEQRSGKRPRKRGRRPRRDKGHRRPRFKRGIYLLPGFFTVSNLFFGFLSIISTMHCLSGTTDDRWSLALSAVFIAIAAILDTLDGRVARLANATSQFGVEFDSLSDIVSFGMAPALMFYVWGLQSLGRVGWLTAFIFLVCCSARLARFNIRVETAAADPRFFVGMPTPASACLLAAVVFALPEPVTDRRIAVLLMVMTVTVSYLMVSNFRYSSFKKISLKSRRPYIFVVLLALVEDGIESGHQVLQFPFGAGHFAGVDGSRIGQHHPVDHRPFAGDAVQGLLPDLLQFLVGLYILLEVTLSNAALDLEAVDR